mmetsp:Transcript_3536/g.6682  ORF Transcript_3536/g.6682 Transcript_3536/m.6682 type:complete len:758 (+) Transcript_3536:187-2460(+)|eukprot:CAMPEP_0182482406 /NCGR_PEP_ID=MMETSP1319-20130603/39229_1 /TAXON_ID=172717 /ORGANISM="Bolidomonas pacifica, Strain RCC208" /LENGTH=757 /DNA_ID=CAMNT_0024684119 /DNA_START=133 /DNA_END=2406 /DNA_ORIENTATION=+
MGKATRKNSADKAQKAKAKKDLRRYGTYLTLGMRRETDNPFLDYDPFWEVNGEDWEQFKPMQTLTSASYVLPSIAVFCLAALPFMLAYDNDKEFQTLWDDHENFVANPRIRVNSDSMFEFWNNMLWMWLDGVVFFVYEPIALTFKLYVNTFLGQTAAINYVINTILHGLNAVLAKDMTILLFRQVGNRINADKYKEYEGDVKIFACVGAVLFATHPLRAEVVAWCSCQPYLLAAHFTLWCVICYLKRQAERAILFFAFASLCKSAVVPLPFALVVFDVLIVHPSKAKSIKNSLKESKSKKTTRLPGNNTKLSLDITRYQKRTTFWQLFDGVTQSIEGHSWFFFISMVIAIVALRSNEFHSSTSTLNAFQSFLQILHTIFWYLSKTFLPTNITGFYPVNEAYYKDLNLYVLLSCAVSLALIVMCIVMVFYFIGKRSSQLMLTFIGVYVLCITPTLIAQHGWPMIGGNRYSYLPSVLLTSAFFSTLAVECRRGHTNPFHWRVQTRPFLLLVFGVVFLFQTRTTISHCKSWNTSLGLWQDIVRTNMESQGDIAEMMRGNLCRALLKKERYYDAYNAMKSGVKRSRLAGKKCSQASHIALATIYYDIGSGFKEGGETSYAVEAYQESLWHNPAYTRALNNVGNIFSEMGRFDTAKEYLEKAIKVEPRESMGYYSLGNAYVREWKYDEGIELYRKAFEYIDNSGNPERWRTLISEAIQRTQDYKDRMVERKAVTLEDDKDEKLSRPEVPDIPNGWSKVKDEL